MADARMVLTDLGPERLDVLRAAAPGLEILVARSLEEARAMAPRADALFGFNDRALYEAAPGLRWVQSGSAGVESYPFDLFRRRGIVLTNAKRIYGVQLADHTLALMLAFSRQLPFLWDAQRRREWVGRERYPPGELDGETLLVVGLGGTGIEVARRAHAFGMRVLATRRDLAAPRPAFVDEIHPPEALAAILPQADWVAVCLPLTAATRGIIGEAELRAMKRSAVIVCVTRGGIINTGALLRALTEGWIAGAGLDVTDPEPLPPDHPLWAAPNIVITPHAAGHSPRAADRMFDLLRENARRFVRGQPLENVVDLNLQY